MTLDDTQLTGDVFMNTHANENAHETAKKNYLILPNIFKYIHRDEYDVQININFPLSAWS